MKHGRSSVIPAAVPENKVNSNQRAALELLRNKFQQNKIFAFE
jgi:hypothetical protein